MSNFLSKSLIHDIEILPNFFSDIFKVPGKNVLFITLLYENEDCFLPEDLWSEIIDSFPNYKVELNSIDRIKKRIVKAKPYLIGYNNYHYDDIIWKEIINRKNITNKDLYEISQSLIGDNKNRLKYDESNIKTIDLMRVSGCDRIYKPLKQTAANLKHDLIQDLPRKYNETIEPYDIPEILLYELNDVLITEKLLLGIPEDQKGITIPKSAYKGLIPAIEFRFDIGNKFGIDIYNNNESQIGEKLAAKLYSQVSGREYDEFKQTQTKRERIHYSDIIFDIIKFKDERLNVFLSKLKNMVYMPEIDKSEKFTFNIEFGDCNIVFGQGGLHGTHKNKFIFNETNTLKIKDLDFSSFYPSLYWKYKIEPEHLPHFNDFVGEIITLRLINKKQGNKLYANALKLCINRLFGSFSDKFGWGYDVKALLQTTINGQLILLMLAEELEENGIKVFYYNTDGLTVECIDTKVELLNSISQKFSDKIKIELEVSDFKSCYIKDVNSFLNIKSDGAVKYKGPYDYVSYIERYGDFDVRGSFNAPIVPYAVSRYLSHNIPLEETIMNHTDIYDFCIANKTGSQFKNCLFEINETSFKEKYIQQSIRYYISKSNNKLFKVKAKSETELESLLKKGKTNVNSYILSDKTFPYKVIHTYPDGKNIYVIEHGSLFVDIFKEWLHYDDVCVGRNITLFNKFIMKDMIDYNIDYNYYIEEAYKLIKNFKV